MSDIAIKVENLGKMYRIGETVTYGTLRESLTHALTAPFRLISGSSNGAGRSDEKNESENHFWALKDVSFEVKRGEVVGVIGRNGAGKSTLLKILSRITEPTEGYAELHGRVGSLLEVGTGFHPELTGRENIFLSAAIMGMKRKEIKRKFDEIVDFSEIEKFIDTPVKRYSSGMYVRLAFAVAAHLEPEILLIDEVLAVGDVAFQKKCLGKMGDVAKQGRTVIFVSHNMAAVQNLCPKGILLENGKLVSFCATSNVIELYLSKIYNRKGSKYFERKPGLKAQILSIRLLDKDGVEISDLSNDQEPILEVHNVINHQVNGCHVACMIYSNDGYHIYSTSDTDINQDLFYNRLPGEYISRVCLPTHFLNAGTYHIDVGIGIPGVEIIDRQNAISFSIHNTQDVGTLRQGLNRAGLLYIQVPWEQELLS